MSALPFTIDQFFDTLAVYNERFAIAVALWWIVCLGSLIAAWQNRARFSSALTYVLSALWMWNAVSYHAVLFTRINPAAWLFALLFTVQAVMLAWAGTRRQLTYFSSHGATFGVGVGLILFRCCIRS